MLNYSLNNILYVLYCPFWSFFDWAERTYPLLNKVSQFFSKITLNIGLNMKEQGTWHVMYSKDKGSHNLLRVLLILIQFAKKKYTKVVG